MSNTFKNKEDNVVGVSSSVSKVIQFIGSLCHEKEGFDLMLIHTNLEVSNDGNEL